MSPRFCLSTSAFRSDTEPMLCDLLTLVEAPSAYRIKDGFLFSFLFLMSCVKVEVDILGSRP